MKISIIGAGFVGSTTAYTLMMKSLAQEIVLVDINDVKAQAESLDILHAAALNCECKIYNGKYENIENSDIVIITVDSQKALTDNRLVLLESNVKIMEQIVPQIVKFAPNCIMLIATNPVDVITKYALNISGFAKEKVIGSGTVLDTARFRTMLGQHFKISPTSVHSYVLGEHGASSLVSWSSATIGGTSIEKYAEHIGIDLTDDFKEKISEDVIDAGFKIYRGKKATYYGIAASLIKICESIIKDKKQELTVSVLHEDICGIKNVCLSLPATVGKNGVSGAIVPTLSDKEMLKLKQSASAMQIAFESIKNS
ncbi:MAG: L-lactate dehydrogenase [Alphaproteobacteria bacterium]|nr:L-lactate dehydrogenase [Alphaproteobacteria bacterium]